ncbi:MAG: hypothetical protein HC805_07350 [Alkalinema sp. RL_2_19]|nr:hypothetical protein [Alkalinema sp. RL_2_19]
MSIYFASVSVSGSDSQRGGDLRPFTASPKIHQQPDAIIVVRVSSANDFDQLPDFGLFLRWNCCVEGVHRCRLFQRAWYSPVVAQKEVSKQFPIDVANVDFLHGSLLYQALINIPTPA